MQQPQAVPIYSDGPAKIGPGQEFIIQRVAKGSGKGEAIRHRNVGEHPLVLARARKKISAEEYTAGAIYRTLCEKLNRSGKDSTVLTIAGGDGAVPWSDAQVAAIQSIQRISQIIGQSNTLILRKFCGEGASATESVHRYVACHSDGVMWRIREALDQLCEALRKLKIREQIVSDPTDGKDEQ